MANCLTVQLRPTKKYAPPSVANLFHNTGLSKATYWLKNSDTIISNIDLKNLTTRKAVSLWNDWVNEATDLVIKNKGKNPQKKQVLIEEGLMVIGKDVKVQNNQDLIKIFEEFKTYFENKYNTKILGFFFHDHEGHIDENEGNFVENRHIHFFFLNVDKYGNSVRRQIKRTDLSEFQTKIYEIGKKYIPDLERATNYKELGLKAPKHKSHREYRTIKIKQELIPQLVQKAEENKKLKEENENLKEQLAKQKDLKEENKRLRALFKELGATREDYRYLEKFVKDLKKLIKDKLLTEKQLKEKIKEIEEKFKEKLLEKNKKLLEIEEENKKLKEKAKELNDLEFYEKKVEIYKVTLFCNTKTLYLIENFLKELKQKNDILDYKKIDEKTTIIQTPYSEIVDTQDKIELKTLFLKNEDAYYNKTILEDQVKLMLDLALAKGWKLEEIQATGSKEFIDAVNKEIQKRLKLKKGKSYDNSFKYKYN